MSPFLANGDADTVAVERTSGKMQKPLGQHEKGSFYASLKIPEKLAKPLWVRTSRANCAAT